MLLFVEGEKPDENQQQAQPAYGVASGNRTRATLVGGECSYHCSISAPLVEKLPQTKQQMHRESSCALKNIFSARQIGESVSDQEGPDFNELDALFYYGCGVLSKFLTFELLKIV